MSRRARRDRRPGARRPESLEARLVMSANPLLSHHGFGGGFQEAPPLTQHGAGPSMGSAIVETAPARDPHADFWLNTGDLYDDDLGERVDQTLNDAHDLTGQDQVLANYGFDGSGQTVVVIDSGIAYSHTALGGGYGEGYRVVGGWDFTENDADFYDDGPEGSHGTHVAGIIGADGSTHDGVATGVDLVGLRVFDDAGNGYFSWVENALSWTLQNLDTFEHRITAINLSLGTEWNSHANPGWAMLENEFASLEAQGVFISVSAGNSFTNYNEQGLSYPASSDHVIPVMSVDNNGNLSYFSQRAEYAIAAPGRWITSTVPDYAANDGDSIDDDWLSMSGTSMAAPYVAGASTLVREAMEFVGTTNIDQWDIYDHLMQTADTFYDSATNANYKRLNLEAAIDALMPTDDFGSSVETAYNLGTLAPASGPSAQGTMSGVISRLDDSDFFTFTAGATGQVTFEAAGTTHGLDAEWGAWGGEWWTDANGDCVMDVIAGQTYTISLSTADGLGYYDLQYQLEGAAFDPIDWGVAGVQQTQSGLSVAGETWYSIATGRSGYFTAIATANSGVTIEAYDANQTLLATGDPSGRVDVVTGAGETILLRVAGEAADFDVQLTNAVSFGGSAVSLLGTTGADTIDFAAGANTHTVSLNGVAYQFAGGEFTNFDLSGGGGADTADVVGGGGAETATLGGGQASVAGDGYTLSVTGVQFTSVDGGGGGDVAFLLDSAGNDILSANPSEVELRTSSGVISAVSGFESVHAYASGGYDIANFYDSQGNDEYRSFHNRAYMFGDGYLNDANGFDRTNAFASTGNDTATFYDSAGDDEFRGFHDRAYLYGDGFLNYAMGFDRANAFASTGSDVAMLWDSAGDDHYAGFEDRAYMFGDGYLNDTVGFDRTDAFASTGNDTATLFDSAGNDEYRSFSTGAYLHGDGFLNYAIGFDRTDAYASGGYDRATFWDSAGDDDFRGFADRAYMVSDGHLSDAEGFDRVTAYSSGGYDVATLYDTAGDDEFRAFGERAYMFGDGYLNDAWGFDRTNAHASSGNDVATFYDTPGDDQYVAFPDRAYMYGDGYLNDAHGFAQAIAYSTLGADSAVFHDSAGNDVFVGRAAYSTISGADYRLTASGFATVTVRATTGQDRAEVHDSAFDDALVALGDTASVGNDETRIEAIGFDHVTAIGDRGGWDSASIGATDFAFEQLGDWA